MDQATIDCLIGALSEILGVTALTALIAYIRGYLLERGASALGEIVAERGFRRLLGRVVRGLIEKGLTRFIPWLGVAFLIWDIYQAFRHCT